LKTKLRSSFIVRVLVLMLMSALLTLAAVSQESIVRFDPAQTKVTFTLDDVLHTVRGTFKLKQGELRFDRQTGAASGALVIDATSGDSDSKARDKKMNKDILQSDRFSEITFIPQKVVGPVPTSGAGQVQVAGIFRIHGADHPLTLTVALQTMGTSIDAKTTFDVPYVEWGIKDPSTFILRVGKSVKIDLAAVGQITTTH
jgi:polyisoprenoid-binding protein YceI